MGAMKVKVKKEGKKKRKTAGAEGGRQRYNKGPEFLAKKLLPVFKKDDVRYGQRLKESHVHRKKLF